MTLYLIAHKVRGEPAFDIASRMEMPDGPWWIIPTSGHRAYPYWIRPLPEDLEEAGPLPLDLPDHYHTEPPRSGRPATPTSQPTSQQRIQPPTPEDL